MLNCSSDTNLSSSSTSSSLREGGREGGRERERKGGRSRGRRKTDIEKEGKEEEQKRREESLMEGREGECYYGGWISAAYLKYCASSAELGIDWTNRNSSKFRGSLGSR